MRARRWTITAWNPTLIGPIEHARTFMKGLIGDTITFIQGQKEICPSTGKEHFQGYVECKAITMTKLKQLFCDSMMHCEPSRANQQSNLDYTSKDESRCPSWDAPISVGVAKQQGTRSDLDAIRQHLVDGGSMAEIAENHFGDYVRYHKGFMNAQLLLRPPRPTADRCVTVYFGGTGTGKTATAYEADPALYRWTPTQAQWWCGYSGHKTLLLDEFRGQLNFGTLLTLLDRYPLNLQVKGATTEHTADDIFITSPVHPVEWFKNLGSQDKLDQLKRRINKIIKTDGGVHVDVTDHPWEEFRALDFDSTQQQF